MRRLKLSKKETWVLVDNVLYSKLSKFTWGISDRGYAWRTSREHKTIYMHRQIMRAGPSDLVDHINGNKLDNRKVNLRKASNAQNIWNSKSHRSWKKIPFKGVTFCRLTDKYKAEITKNKKRYYLGLHARAEDAAEAYNKAAKKLFKEFAKLNEIGNYGNK